MFQGELRNMDNNEILRIAQESMRDNRNLLNNLGAERAIRLEQNPDEDIIEKLKELVPKSTEGKIVAVGVALLLAYILFKK